MAFAAPVSSLQFALVHIAEIERLKAGGAFPDFDLDLLSAVLEGGAALADGVLAPINRAGDKVGAKFENGKVVCAPGFADAYRQFAEGGWNGLAAAPEYGGQGLPKALELAVFEMVHAANMALGLCPLLTQGAIEAIFEHGTDAQKALYLPPMIAGRWTGAMTLTEPQSGSDLSLVRSQAVPDGNGAYKITGQKIYITWGDHDAAENGEPAAPAIALGEDVRRDDAAQGGGQQDDRADHRQAGPNGTEVGGVAAAAGEGNSSRENEDELSHAAPPFLHSLKNSHAAHCSPGDGT